MIKKYLATFLLLFSLMLSSTQAAENKALSFDFERLQVSKAIEVIAKFADLEIEGLELVKHDTVTICAENEPWDEALRMLLASQSLTAKINGLRVTISKIKPDKKNH